MPGLFDPPNTQQYVPPPSQQQITGAMNTMALQGSALPIQPQQQPPTDAQTVDAMNALAQLQQKPKYSIGNPLIDRYINMFIGD
jgi:hypothetical protein